MKNYILTLLFAFVALTSCNNDEYYYKTPGEITGEKIIEMVKANNYITLCVIPGIYSEPRSFHVDGQFLHLDAGNGWREVIYDLNHLLNWEYIPQNNSKATSVSNLIWNNTLLMQPFSSKCNDSFSSFKLIEMLKCAGRYILYRYGQTYASNKQ